MLNVGKKVRNQISAKVRKNTQTDFQKHIIGVVPDQGGQANEHQPPPPEIPLSQKNRSQGRDGQGGGGSGGGGCNWSVQVHSPSANEFRMNFQNFALCT